MYCNTLWDCLYFFKNPYMTCDLYFKLLLCNEEILLKLSQSCIAIEHTLLYPLLYAHYYTIKIGIV